MTTTRLFPALLAAASVGAACGRTAPPDLPPDTAQTSTPREERPAAEDTQPAPSVPSESPPAATEASPDAGTAATASSEEPPSAPEEPAVLVEADPDAAPAIAKVEPPPTVDDGFDLRRVHTTPGAAPDDALERPPRTDEPTGSPNIDPTWTREGIDDVPVFPDDDPLVTSGIPVCRAFAEGMKACRPKLDPETRALLDPLIASILNSARALRRPHVRLKACEMGWNSLPAMLEKYCPGSFDPTIPRESPSK
jgi:hypothetical protein